MKKFLRLSFVILLVMTTSFIHVQATFPDAQANEIITSYRKSMTNLTHEDVEEFYGGAWIDDLQIPHVSFIEGTPAILKEQAVEKGITVEQAKHSLKQLTLLQAKIHENDAVTCSHHLLH